MQKHKNTHSLWNHWLTLFSISIWFGVNLRWQWCMCVLNLNHPTITLTVLWGSHFNFITQYRIILQVTNCSNWDIIFWCSLSLSLFTNVKVFLRHHVCQIYDDETLENVEYLIFHVENPPGPSSIILEQTWKTFCYCWSGC